MEYTYHQAKPMFYGGRPCNRIAVVGRREDYLALQSVFQGIDWEVLVHIRDWRDTRSLRFERVMKVGTDFTPNLVSLFNELVASPEEQKILLPPSERPVIVIK